MVNSPAICEEHAGLYILCQNDPKSLKLSILSTTTE